MLIETIVTLGVGNLLSLLSKNREIFPHGLLFFSGLFHLPLAQLGFSDLKCRTIYSATCSLSFLGDYHGTWHFFIPAILLIISLSFSFLTCKVTSMGIK